MKKILIATLALVMALSLAACGGKDTGSTTPPANNTPSNTAPADNTPSTPAEEPSGEEIDLSQFTAVEIPECDFVEDWMIPGGGVVTKASYDSNAIPAYFYMDVSGITVSQLDDYRKVLTDNGMVRSYSTFKNDKAEISLGTSAVGATADSILYVTIKPVK